MTEQRIPLDDLTSDALDQLYADLHRYEEVQGEMNERTIGLTRRVADLEAENNQLRDALAHCRHKPRVAALEQRVAELTAGQCTHAAVPDLRTRGVASLTAAACDGDCGLTEQACQAAHPITRCLAGGVTHIDGPVDCIVDTVLAAAAHTEQPAP